MITRTARLSLLMIAACSSGSIDKVTPGEVYLGRTVNLVITGDGTDFSDTSHVELGDGVTQLETHATSPTELEVTAVVSTAAPLGPRDVFVDGDVLSDAFTVMAPATASVTAGTPQRGGLVAVHLALVEPGRMWSANDVSFFASPGLTIDAQRVDDAAIDALVAIDADAPLGDAVLEVHARGDVFTVPAAFAVADAGDAPVLHDTLHISPDAMGAAFAWIAPASSLALVDLEVGAGGAGALVLDADGAYPRPLAFTATQTAVIDGVRGVSFYGDSGPFDVTAHRHPVRSVSATDDNKTLATAALLGSPDAYVSTVTLDHSNDVRYFAVDVADASIGQRLRVVTLGDRRADTELAVLRDDRVSLLGPASSDTTTLDDLLTPPLPAAGRYYIRVTAGAGFDPTHSTFSLAVVTQ